MDCGCSFEDTSFLGNTCGSDPNVTLFMSLVDLMLRNNCMIADTCRRYTRTYDRNNYFDFIIIGGGVAGPVVASRLSENKKWRVLLIEAGPEEPTVTSVPAFATSSVGTDLDWKYKTIKQQHACLADGGICNLPRGKMLGGTAAMSGMMYVRGHKNIFNNWAKEGNTGWTYYECLQFFKKSEANKEACIEKAYHGTDGPIVVQQFPHQPEIVKDLIKAGIELGFENRDLNGANHSGIAIAPMMVHNGLRASTPRLYLRPKRKNLVVQLDSRVVKIIIKNKKAVGIEYYNKSGEKHTAYSSKEIILSAGAYGSPQILMLSGIGPAEELKKHKIEIIEDLKVGHNLHNHVSINVSFQLSAPNQEILNLETLNEYLVNLTGPMASTGITQVTVFKQTVYSEMADIQLFFDGFITSCPWETKKIQIRPTNVLAKSKGILKLKSNDPFDDPLINFNYLSHKQDVDVLLEGIKLAIQLSKTKALEKWDIKLLPSDPKEKCKHLLFPSDSYWKCIIKMYTGPENHPGGTCKMGPLRTRGAVVDPELRVHGIPNLRVIDASVFPYVPNSNPIASIIMVAEKGSYLIHHAWN